MCQFLAHLSHLAADGRLVPEPKFQLLFLVRSYVKTAILMFSGSAANGGSQMAVMTLAGEKSSVKSVCNSSEILVSRRRWPWLQSAESFLAEKEMRAQAQ